MKLNPKVYTDAAEVVATNAIGCCIALLLMAEIVKEVNL